MDLHTSTNLVRMTEIEPLCASSVNLADMLTMLRR